MGANEKVEATFHGATGSPWTEEDRAVTLNPEAVGNPERIPHVRVPPEMLALLRHCPACGGVNGFHTEGCQP